MSEASKLVVIDTGSWTTKVGFAGDDKPKKIIPSLVASDSQKSSVKVGEAAKGAYDKLEIRCPLEDGYINNWDDVEKLWEHVFNDVLSTQPSTCNVLLSDSTTNTRENREKMAQIMFEKFGVSGLFIAKQSVLGMYSTGRVTGLVVDSGHVSTHVVPVYEGFCVKECIERIPIAGKSITEYLSKALQDKGIKFSSKAYPVFEAAKMKEWFCNVVDNFDEGVKKVDNKEYELPDGTKVVIGKESVEAAELLFRPQLLDPKTDQNPLPKVIQSCIGKCEIDARAPLTSAITLIGGTSAMNGFSERVAKEVTGLMGPKVKVVSNTQRAVYTWIGGSVLASLPQTDWITSKEYRDQGQSVIKKCP